MGHCHENGAPNRVVGLDKGGDLWTYDYGRQGTLPASGQHQRLNLVFDKSGRLAEWDDKEARQ
jgi:hypothetical protein